MGVTVFTAVNGQSGAGMMFMHFARTSGWHHVADFFPQDGATDGDNVTRSGALAAAVVSAIPDGNHGDNRTSA